ncbi:MAG: orotidine-5'-phosphate decarboxylase [Candidatus Dormibacteraeota bacterium]|nr:orotidine-5'-phosphate decarboxylase [Candidatus Dormibacteraeota bacterium]MBV9524292.1 orotidine-5'-phosphate decarboxylase [Candidatus Dormibacteraeota bacterium]
MTFAERLDVCVERADSLLCVGLDPAGMESAEAAERQCLDVLDATLDLVCAVKPNVAFFEQFGAAGYAALERLRPRIPEDRMLILDAKRGDVGSSAEAYARALFDVLGADAVTVNPLQGGDAVAPFLSRAGRGAFLLTRTSNPGAADLLDQQLADGTPVYRRIVQLGLGWDQGGRVGFVVGATDPAAVAAVRAAAPEAPLLVPGVGAQGGALEESVRAGLDPWRRGLVVNVSRGIAGAAEGPRAAAVSFRDRINAVRVAAPASA